MSAKLLDILRNKTQADEVHVRLDQVEETLSPELTEELCYKSSDIREAKKTQSGLIKQKKQRQAYKIGTFARNELVAALSEVLEPEPGTTNVKDD